MGAVYRKTFTKPLPEGAEIIVRAGERLARWKGPSGKTRTAPLAVGADGVERVTLQARTYTAKLRNAAGIIVERPTGCRDEQAARGVLAELERRAELGKAGIVKAEEDAVADQQDTPLAAHLDAYGASMKARGLSARHVAEARRYLDIVARECGFARLADLDARPVELYLARRREKGLRARMLNYLRQVLVAFGNWAVSTNRLTRNPFERLPVLDEASDRRIVRRALTAEELSRPPAPRTARPSRFPCARTSSPT